MKVCISAMLFLLVAAAQDRCASWCANHKDPWSGKCYWRSGACSACRQCDLELTCSRHRDCTSCDGARCAWDGDKCSYDIPEARIVTCKDTTALELACSVHYSCKTCQGARCAWDGVQCGYDIPREDIVDVCEDTAALELACSINYSCKSCQEARCAWDGVQCGYDIPRENIIFECEACKDTEGWKNRLDMTCKVYEAFASTNEGICATMGGESFGFPELHCCACKGVEPQESDISDFGVCQDTPGWNIWGQINCEFLTDWNRCEMAQGPNYNHPELNCCGCGKPYEFVNSAVYEYGKADCEDTKNWISGDYLVTALTCDDYSMYDGLLDGVSTCEDFGGVEYRYPKDNCCYCGKTVCTNTPDWKNDHDLTCAMYESLNLCDKYSGEDYGYPEKNCCACRQGIVIKDA